MAATGHDLYIDRTASEFAMGYRPTGFIADMIFPTVSVPQQSGVYAEFSRSDALRRQQTKRSPGSEAKTIFQEVGSGSFYCNNYALKTPLTIEDRSNAEPIYYAKLVEGRAAYVLDHLMLDWEIRVASQVTSTSNVGSSAAVSSGWTDAANSDPLGNMNTAIDNVHDSTGIRPSDIIFGQAAWRTFRRHDDVRGLIFGNNNGGGYPSTEQVANLLNVDRVHVGGAYRNTGGEGLSESLSQVWGDNVLIYYRPDAPAIDVPSFAYSVRWSAPGLPNMQVERHPYDSRKKVEEIEVGYYQDEKITGSSYGFLLTAVNSST